MHTRTHTHGPFCFLFRSGGQSRCVYIFIMKTPLCMNEHLSYSERARDRERETQRGDSSPAKWQDAGYQEEISA